ncbi:pantoate--beta-alanine ligase [Methylophaga sp. 42_25_T18]|mgnify:CR=1 FL=1|nr:pantoate--beta-alanine ligase [Methylophaga sp. 42_25_T18]OUR88037.1 pantoate--beta-alanine ligase [Methylophaga sp. 42_8_T64]
MQRVETVNALRAQVKAWRDQNKIIAFVPTMGNLHQGHLSLVQKAQELADKVIVSIFVNPLQFDDQADLSAYPRTMDADIKQLMSVATDLVFTPNIDVMYPQGMEAHSTVVVPGMDDKLCGKNRPGHFDGVATVVSKFFNMVQADIAIFGEKDYQQLLLIKKLVLDLNLPIEVIGSETFRDESGLAMSSRNQYLTDSERKKASVLYQTLMELKNQLEQGEQDFKRLQQQAVEKLKLAGFSPDYVEIRRAGNLDLVNTEDTDLRILVAAYLGKARLIDNIACNLA